MKVGGYDRVADGFTIVEVMIVLAVSSLLLISAAALIDGRQAKTEFTTGIHDEQQKIQQIINETSSGYYPNGHNFTCNGSASGPVSFTAGANAQGTNAGCIFLGKALQFGLGPSVPQNGTVGVLPIVGNQYESVGGVQTPVLTVGASVPRAAYPINASEVNVPTSTAESEAMEYGLHLANSNAACGFATAVCYKPVAGGGFAATGIAAFLSGDSAGNITATTGVAGSANLQSGSQQLSLYGVKGGSVVNQSMYQASNALGTLSRSTGLGNFDPASELLICVASGGTNQSGLFTIGGGSVAGGNGGLNVGLSIWSGTVC
jgi:prepilin-type N-terminal cleavage/methylation domain-containing protein